MVTPTRRDETEFSTRQALLRPHRCFGRSCREAWYRCLATSARCIAKSKLVLKSATHLRAISNIAQVGLNHRSAVPASGTSVLHRRFAGVGGSWRWLRRCPAAHVLHLSTAAFFATRRSDIAEELLVHLYRPTLSSTDGFSLVRQLQMARLASSSTSAETAAETWHDPSPEKPRVLAGQAAEPAKRFWEICWRKMEATQALPQQRQRADDTS